MTVEEHLAGVGWSVGYTTALSIVRATDLVSLAPAAIRESTATALGLRTFDIPARSLRSPRAWRGTPQPRRRRHRWLRGLVHNTVAHLVAGS